MSKHQVAAVSAIDPKPIAELFSDAIKKNDLALVQSLLSDGADVNAQNAHGWTPLQEAAARTVDLSISELLLENNADAALGRGSENHTPLYYAALQNNLPLSKLLLQKQASASQDEQAVLKLIAIQIKLPQKDQDLDLLQLVSKTKLSEATATKSAVVLCAASGEGHQEIVQLLIAMGVDINAFDQDNNTPLHVAARNNNPEVSQILLDAKADLSVQNGRGNTPLHVASLMGYAKVMPVLLDAKADPSAQNGYGNTSLHEASYMGHSAEAVQVLLDAKADPSAQNRYGNTPLHVAAKSIGGMTYCGDTKTVQMLLDARADPMAQNGAGNTPLALADEFYDKSLRDAANNPARKVYYENGTSVNEEVIRILQNTFFSTHPPKALHSSTDEVHETYALHEQVMACAEKGEQEGQEFVEAEIQKLAREQELEQLDKIESSSPSHNDRSAIEHKDSSGDEAGAATPPPAPDDSHSEYPDTNVTAVIDTTYDVQALGDQPDF